jgi:hypothetical protein
MVPDNQSQPILKHATLALGLVPGGALMVAPTAPGAITAGRGEGSQAQGGESLLAGSSHQGPASASISDGEGVIDGIRYQDPIVSNLILFPH